MQLESLLVRQSINGGRLILAGLICMLGMANQSDAASRYWVGPSNGDWFDTANWSTVSGGAGGASVPIAGDRAIIDAGGTANISSGSTTMTRLDVGLIGSTGTLNISGNAAFTASGNWQGLYGNVGGTAYINQTGSSTVTFDILYWGSPYSNHPDGGTPGNAYYMLDGADAVLNITNSIYSPALSGGNANFDFKQGTVNIKSDINLAAVAGTNMTGIMYLGKTGNVTVNQTQAGRSLKLGYLWAGGDNGRLEGVGTVHMTGTLENHGRVIANGWGTDRTLDLSSFTTVTTSYLDNYQLPTGSGWWATNHGKLLLPDLAITANESPASYYWGQGNTYNLVHSVKATFDAVTTAGNLTISLLADDRAELGTTKVDTTAAGGLINGIYDIVAAPSLDFSTVTLLFRYDNYALTTVQEDALKLYKSQGNGWVDASTLPGVSITLNTTANTISASGLTDFSLFAIGTNIQGIFGAVPLIGDLNNDSVVNNQDIAPFVLALTDLSTWQSTYPALNILDVGDINGDDVFNNQDIAPFVTLLTGSGSSLSAGDAGVINAIPEPATLGLLAIGSLVTLGRGRRRA